MHFIRDYPQRKIKDEKDFQVTTASSIKYRFRDEIEIFECPEASQGILQHPKCPFTQFAFAGECEIDLSWYYIEANEAVSKNDFKYRIKICRKESKESRYWLRLLELRDAEQEEERQALAQEATELMKIFGSILQKSK